MTAGMPGEMHAFLAEHAGVWYGESTMWMFPGSDPIYSSCTVTITSIMEGRYMQAEMAGEMPGMGPFTGLGINGYNNVSQEFTSNWIDNHSTGMWRGSGELSSDKKTLTWSYTFSCPVTGKDAHSREVERFISPTEKVMEMHITDPKSGEEYQMMEIKFTKES